VEPLPKVATEREIVDHIVALAGRDLSRLADCEPNNPHLEGAEDFLHRFIDERARNRESRNGTGPEVRLSEAKARLAAVRVARALAQSDALAPLWRSGHLEELSGWYSHRSRTGTTPAGGSVVSAEVQPKITVSGRTTRGNRPARRGWDGVPLPADETARE
jgi:hypothetical protein